MAQFCKNSIPKTRFWGYFYTTMQTTLHTTMQTFRRYIMKEYWGKTELKNAITHLKSSIERDEERLRELQAIEPYPDNVVERIEKAKPREKYYGYQMKLDGETHDIYNGVGCILGEILFNKNKIALVNGKDIIVEIEKPFEPSTYKKLSIKEVFDI